jgi:hypothetical protein
MSTTPTRNYAAEAVDIAAGTSRLLPERAHLQALAAQMESVLLEHRGLAQILAAVMVDTGQQNFFLPSDALADVERHRLNVVVTRHPRGMTGAVLVELSRRPAAGSNGRHQ